MTNKIILGILSVLVIVVITVGVYFNGSPVLHRSADIDEQSYNNTLSLLCHIKAYKEQHKQYPEIDDFISLKQKVQSDDKYDPNEKYGITEYKGEYTICTKFLLDAKTANRYLPRHGKRYYNYRYRHKGARYHHCSEGQFIVSDDFIIHEAGEKCYSFKLRPKS